MKRTAKTAGATEPENCRKPLPGEGPASAVRDVTRPLPGEAPIDTIARILLGALQRAEDQKKAEARATKRKVAKKSAAKPGGKARGTK